MAVELTTLFCIIFAAIGATVGGVVAVISPEYVVLEGGTLWEEIQYLITHNIPWSAQ